MAIKPISKRDLEQGQEELKNSLPTAPKPVNLTEARELARALPLEYRGRKYMALPISADDGFELQAVMKEIDDLKFLDAKAASMPIIKSTIHRALKIMGKHIVPAGLPIRLSKVLKAIGILPNPIRHASEGEVGVLLGFFFRLRQRSTVRS